MKNGITFRTKNGELQLAMSEDFAQFAIENDEARELLKSVLEKMNAFEAKHLTPNQLT